MKIDKEYEMTRFWKNQQARFRSIPVIPGTSMEIVANMFYLAAKHNVDRLQDASGYKHMNLPFQNALRQDILEEFHIA